MKIREANIEDWNKLSKFYDLHKNVTLDHKSVNFKEQYFKELLTKKYDPISIIML